MENTETQQSKEEVKKKRPVVKAPLAQFVAIIALSISIFLIVDLGRRATANYRIQREAARLSQEVEAAQRYQDKLLAQRTYAASDLYVEEIARRELKWAKPDEVVIAVLPTPEASQPFFQPPEAKEVPGNPAPTTPLQAWWHLFFDQRQDLGIVEPD